MLCVAIHFAASADQSISLEWIASPSPLAAGYAVYYGLASGSYDSRFDAGTNTTATITNLSEGPTYYFAVATYDVNNNESIPSNEVTYSMPSTPPTFSSVELQNGQVVMTWAAIRGRAYQIQFKTSLNQIAWRPLSGLVRATCDSATYSDTTGSNRQRFYRLTLLPELLDYDPVEDFRE